MNKLPTVGVECNGRHPAGAVYDPCSFLVLVERFETERSSAHLPRNLSPMLKIISPVHSAVLFMSLILCLNLYSAHQR